MRLHMPESPYFEKLANKRPSSVAQTQVRAYGCSSKFEAGKHACGSAVFRALSISKRKASLLSRSVGKRRAQTRSAATRRAARLDQTLIEQLGDNIEPWCLFPSPLFIRSRSATQRGSDAHARLGSAIKISDPDPQTQTLDPDPPNPEPSDPGPPDITQPAPRFSPRVATIFPPRSRGMKFEARFVALTHAQVGQLQ